MRIAHITDAQLGYRQYGLAGREQDYYDALMKSVNEMSESGVELALFTGDQFEMVRPPACAVSVLKLAVESLKEAGIRVAGIEGNHDATGGHWLNVCGIQNLNDAPYAGLRAAGPNTAAVVRVGGISYVKDNEFLGVLQDYLAKHGHMDILCMHQGMTEVCPFTSIKMADVTALVKPAGVKYLACGHIHNRFYLQDGGIIYSCPGSTEMTDMNEKPEKWWSIIDTDSWTTVYRKIPVRPVVMLMADTDEQFEKVLADVSGREVPYSFAMVSVNRNIMDGAERICRAAEARKTALRLMMYSPDQVKVAVDAKPSWERDKGMLDLREMVARDYAPGTEQHALITQIIDAPERAEEILAGFISSKLETA